jgi:hypothetical protein
MAHGTSARVLTIEEVVSRFEQWRQRRQGKARIPDELWSAAVEVARRDGVNRTAAALHLDGGKLKQRMMAADTVASKAAAPAFVEFMAPVVSGLPDYTIELEGPNGRLRIHCKGATATNLAELSRALWDVAS